MAARGHDASATMGAKEFHEKTGITESLRRIEKIFRETWVDPQTGRIKREYVFDRACPLCKKIDGETAFVKNGFKHVRCSCGMIYVPEVLKDEYLNYVYADPDYEKETHASFRTEPRKSFIEAIYLDGLSLLDKAGANPGKMLDVGCSSGLFMELALKHGFSVRGVEPSEYAVNVAKQHGLDVIQGYFGKGMFEENSYDVVVLWDVLEHCEEPGEILEAVIDVLRPGGAFFLQVPNAMGLAPRIMRQDCNMFTGFGHINLFGPETLQKVLKKNGFTRIMMQTVISEISVINNYINFHDPYHGPSLEKENILGVIDIDTIHKKLLGYKLQAVGKKAD
jgi:2-polyprenyl-3-methyl-5-hydroxy-6-metoxy-1,4-benzoquinol methylase